MKGILIGDKHTAKDWGLIWTATRIPYATPKIHTVEIPGHSGVLDFTELMGGVKYENRKLEFEFTSRDKGIAAWQSLYSEIANFCHGKVMKIIMDIDAGYYWTGRVHIDSKKDKPYHGEIIMTVDADPYKYSVENSIDEWKWSTFNLRTGIAKNYNNVAISGTTTIDILGVKKDEVPIITCSKAMTMLFEGKTYQLASGENVNYDIVLKNGTNQMKFTVSGSGTVTILFRGASL